MAQWLLYVQLSHSSSISVDRGYFTKISCAKAAMLNAMFLAGKVVFGAFVEKLSQSERTILVTCQPFSADITEYLITNSSIAVDDDVRARYG